MFEGRRGEGEGGEVGVREGGWEWRKEGMDSGAGGGGKAGGAGETRDGIFEMVNASGRMGVGTGVGVGVGMGVGAEAKFDGENGRGKGGSCREGVAEAR
jgi:hypothetical protein